MTDTAMREIGGHLLPYSEDTSVLGRAVSIPGEQMVLKNAISVQPLEGADSEPNGAPGELTLRRYRRFLGSGAGLVWVESVAVQEDGRSNPNALWIHDGNLDAYKRFVGQLKEEHPDVPLIAQLTHSGRFSQPHGKPEPIIATFNPHYDGRVKVPRDYPVVSDAYLDRLPESFAHAAMLCRQAGFDGVDVKACHGYLFSELLSAFNRPGRYGGLFENRVRLLLDTVDAVKAQHGHELVVASRICHADTVPAPFGFGMSQDGSLNYDSTETLKLVAELHRRGVNLLNVSVGRVTVNPEYHHTGMQGIPVDSDVDLFARFYGGTKTIAEAFPDLCVVGSGYSLLRADAPQVAAGVLASGGASVAGFGRQALACPNFANAAIAGTFGDERLCTLCGNCYKLLRALAPTGCPTRDSEVYLPLLKRVLGKA